MPGLDKELDRLFALPREEFTAARNELAKRLKKEGDPEAAAEVKALAKPTAAAAELNRLAREEPALVKKLRAAGERLRKAQAKAISGGGAGELREATAAERDAERELVAAAERTGAVSPSTLDAVRRTLTAAALDPEAGELLARGRLAKELEATGFPAVGSLGAAKPRPTARTETRRDDEAERRRSELSKQLRETKRELAAATRESSRLGRDADRARAEASRREQAHEAALKRQEELAEEVARLQSDASR